jgi:hypothetical protein
VLRRKARGFSGNFQAARLRLELGTTLFQLTRELGSVRCNRMMQDDGEFAD